MSVTWDPPQKSNGQILQCKIEINGKAIYTDDSGRVKTEHLRPFIDYVDFQYNTFRKNQLPPNTNYTVSRKFNQQNTKKEIREKLNLAI